MSLPRKRPCTICRRWFRPDNRVSDRQHACSRPECQLARRRKQQAAWRRRNPDYFAARRMLARKSIAGPVEPLRVPPPLNQLPWDIAQSEFGVQGADFMGIMGTLLLHTAQSQFSSQVTDSQGNSGTLLPVAAQSQIAAGADWSGARNRGDAAGMAPT